MLKVKYFTLYLNLFRGICLIEAYMDLIRMFWNTLIYLEI